MFPNARVHIDGGELAWAIAEPWGTTPVPELYVRELDKSPQRVILTAGAHPLPLITCHLTPGHTPGHVIFVLEGKAHDIIFTGDAAKNRSELLSRTADMTYDPAISRASIESIWSLWRQRTGSVLVPGHDIPMTLVDGTPKYLVPRSAGVAAWFGDTLDQASTFDLSELSKPA